MGIAADSASFLPLPRPSSRDNMQVIMNHLFATLLLLCFPFVCALGQTNYTPRTFYRWAGSATTLGEVDGTNQIARFNVAVSVAADSAANIYVVDAQGKTVRKITPAGVVSTLAGSAGTMGTNDGIGSSARFTFPQGVAADSAGNVYVVESTDASAAYGLRKITPAGVVTRMEIYTIDYLDQGIGGVRHDLPYLSSIALDKSGNMFVAGIHGQVYRVYGNYAQPLSGVYGSRGTNDGYFTNAFFGETISGLAVDSRTNIYVSDTANHTIRKITPDLTITTIAGAPGQAGSNDGPGILARFNNPGGLVVDTNGNIFVTDFGNFTVRKITPDGTVTTVAGVPGVAGVTDGDGASARFAGPSGVALDSLGSIYVADYTSIRVSFRYVNTWISDVGGKWEDSLSWSLDAPPSTNDVVDYITNVFSKNVTIDLATVQNAAESLVINDLFISAPDGDLNSLSLVNMGSAHSLRVLETLVLDGRGGLLITNSSLIAANLSVGWTNGNGAVIVRNGGRLQTDLGVVGFLSLTNNALVVGSGASWTNHDDFYVGYYTSANGLLIGEGGVVVSEGDTWLGLGGYYNTIAVTNTGSLWRTEGNLTIGREGSINLVLAGSGGTIVNDGSVALGSGGDNNLAVVTDPGSTWRIAGEVVLGADSGSLNGLLVANGATMQVGSAGNLPLNIGFGGNTNIVAVTGSGSRLDCSGPINLAHGGPMNQNVLEIEDAAMVITPSLVVSNDSLVLLNGGTLKTGGTVMNSGALLRVGDGVQRAALYLNGGDHWFFDGLEVADHSALTGCGTIHGNVTIRPGATVEIGCCGPIIFAGNVTNYGVIIPSCNSLTFSGVIMNFGVILTNSAPSGPPACLTVTNGSIVGQPENETYVVTDDNNEVQLNWSAAAPGSSGFVYATFTTDVAIAVGVTNIDQISNAAGFNFATNFFDAVGEVYDAAANGGIGQFVVLRNRYSGHYAVVRFDDFLEDSSLNATWWFQSAGGGNFSCAAQGSAVVSPVTNLALNAQSGTLAAAFNTEPGRAYTIQYRTNLTTSPWISLTNIAGDGLSHTLPLPANRPQGFYRVLTQ